MDTNEHQLNVRICIVSWKKYLRSNLYDLNALGL